MCVVLRDLMDIFMEFRGSIRLTIEGSCIIPGALGVMFYSPTSLWLWRRRVFDTYILWFSWNWKFYIRVYLHIGLLLLKVCVSRTAEYKLYNLLLFF